MDAQPSSAGLPPQADPPKDQSGKPVPEGIANFLAILRVLLGYGQHLADTLESRAARRGFGPIARCFGTAKVAIILAHLTRGIRRAIALEHVLLARAARGRDIVVPALRSRSPARQPGGPAAGSDGPCIPDAAATPADAPDAGSDTEQTAPPATHGRRRIGPKEPPDLAHLPSIEELEARIRRRPLARALADICRDFGVVPGFCTGWFWNRLFETLISYDGGFPGFMEDVFQRREDFANSDAAYNPAMYAEGEARGDTRGALGFLIGETPVDPFDDGKHAATASTPLTTGAVLLGRPEVGVPLATLVKAGVLPASFPTGPP